MQLTYLLQNHYLLPSPAERTVDKLVTDSRQIQPGNLFIALAGQHTNGADYIAAAIAQGAAAVLINAQGSQEPITYQNNVPIIPIQNLQQSLGELAARFYHYPSQKLRIIGVTGTNGKTTCTHFLAQMLESLGIRCGIIGTLGCGFYGQLQETGFTTPDAIRLQSILDRFVKEGAKAIAMEVSSHSIHQGRINGIDFEAAIFTNLTQDHLDYHGTMENYAAEKYRFLAEFPVKQLVINQDDAYGKKWVEKLQQSQRSVYGYSKTSNSRHQEFSLRGIKASITTNWGDAILTLPVVGEFNLDNALAVVNVLCLMGFSLEKIVNEMQYLKAVPGRMQTVGHGKQPLIIVDFAHTPDALEKVLQTLRSLTKARLICVFGCGGDRDQSKRALMGAIVEKLADVAIITNDNPRDESPEEIASNILAGFTNPGRALIELDRSKAIEKSIQLASATDCILIAGKGAERYQQIGNEKLPFSDVEQALSFINEKV